MICKGQSTEFELNKIGAKVQWISGKSFFLLLMRLECLSTTHFQAPTKGQPLKHIESPLNEVTFFLHVSLPLCDLFGLMARVLPCSDPWGSPVACRFVPEPWSTCSATCGPGVQVREVKCRVLLTFTQTETELPEEECEGPRLPTERPCLLQPCDESPAARELAASLQEQDSETTYDWEYAGFTPCTATCLGGI